jgi:hypothetical protein
MSALRAALQCAGNLVRVYLSCNKEGEVVGAYKRKL